ncbi:hypothetical protein [Plesiomonas shigelloides]|uniref:hypothetical protein n=1 Tax=Plesiomonas shigelloides TaxID=703 RepID=UPI000691DF2F|nr:hypothetical protein [Plesiomonas shigelloides]
MSENITLNVSKSTFDRLAALAIGFDTPEAVINRLIDQVSGLPTEKPEILFKPSEAEFKKLLLENKAAEAKIYFNDGMHAIVKWNASKFKESSNLRANLWSGLLRDWRQRKISKIELIPLKPSHNHKLLEIAHAIGLLYEEAEIVKPEIHYEGNETHLVHFNHPDMNILKNVSQKLNSDLDVYLPSELINLP